MVGVTFIDTTSHLGGHDQGGEVDNVLDSVSSNVSDRVDQLAERMVSKKADSKKARPWNDALVQRYFPYFVVVCIVMWLISCILTGSDTFGEVIRILCLVFVVGFAVLGLIGYTSVPSGPFPRWTLSGGVHHSGHPMGHRRCSGVMIYEASSGFPSLSFGFEVSVSMLKTMSLLLIFLFTMFTTVGVLMVTVSYLRVYLVRVFKTMQCHTADGSRGKAESFFMVQDIIDVREVRVGHIQDGSSFNVSSLSYLFMYMVVLGALISSYLFVNPYFLQSMSQRTMLTIMVMLTMFVPVLIIPLLSVKQLNARTVSDAPRDYMLWQGAKTRLFYTFAGLSVFMMMFIISLYFGFTLIGILDNYLDFLVPLILTSAMYSFVYANNFSKVLLEYVCDEYNSWKCGEDVGA